MGGGDETIELGGSELVGFLGNSLPPPFPPLRANFFFEFFFEFFYPRILSYLSPFSDLVSPAISNFLCWFPLSVDISVMNPITF